MSDVEPSRGESSESQFVDQSGDDENLWEVIEITAEKGKLYKVRWAGTDPSTGKPWKQSWVPHCDCTPALVDAWKRKRREKTSKSAAGSARSKTSVASTYRKSSTPSTAVPESPHQFPQKRSRHSSVVGAEIKIGPPSKKRKTTTSVSAPRTSTDEIMSPPPIKPNPKPQATPSVDDFAGHNGLKSPDRPKTVLKPNSKPSSRDHPTYNTHRRTPTPPPRISSPPNNSTPPQASTSKPEARSPQLSPRAKARLALWERDVHFPREEEEEEEEVLPAHSDSGLNGLVPETRQEAPAFQPFPVQTTNIMHIPSTPRSNMVSRMKPKTPLSRSSSNLTVSKPRSSPNYEPKKKILKPIPVVTPSVFAPHLPSTNGNDTIESAEHDESYEEPIDQFSSPIKGPLSKSPAKADAHLISEISLDIRSSRALPERHKDHRPRAGSGAFSDRHRRTPPPQIDVPPSPQIDQLDIREYLREEEEESTQEVEAELKQTNEVIMNGKAGASPSTPLPEVSETLPQAGPSRRKTPSLSEGAQVLSNRKATSSHPSEVLDETKVMPSTAGTSQESGDRNSSQRSQSYPPTQTRHLGAALELLNVKSEENLRIEVELSTERTKRLSLEKEIEELRERLAQSRVSADTAGTELDRARDLHAADKTSWESRLEVLMTEKAELEREHQRLVKADKQRALDQVEWNLERKSLEDSISLHTSARRELEDKRDQWENERRQFVAEKALWEQERASLVQSAQVASKQQTEWDTERSQWQAEKAKLDAEITTLKASVEFANSSKKSVEKDLDFFREQYAQASGYVTTVREENAELEKRTKIAESQTSTGVESVKMLYEARIQAIEQEAARFKYLTSILTERDMRTGGDDIRRRANLEPQLRRRVEELEHVVSQMDDEISIHETRAADLEKGREQLLQRNEVWRKVVEVQAEEIARRNKLAASQLSITEASIAPSQLSAPSGLLYPDDSSDEMVYRCVWRFDTTVPPFSCNAVFSDVKEFEEHVISAHASDRSEDVDES